MSHVAYTDFASFLDKHFECKVQKITINGGFSCPNRTGEKGRGGCSYCNNQTFNPAYCTPSKSITEQIQKGIQFFSHKYPSMRYLAYFQAYTNTYADLSLLQSRYEEALHVAGVVGIVIGTRPDCVSEELLDYLSELNKRTFLLVEYGIESTNDTTLQRINRGHTYADTVKAVIATHARGIRTGGHVILGLPQESRNDILQQANDISLLPLDVLKIHQLQIIKGTQMAQEYATQPQDFPLVFDNPDDYIALVVDYLTRLRADLVIERFVSSSPPELLIAPKWNLKNHEFTARILANMRQRRARQGQCHTPQP